MLWHFVDVRWSISEWKWNVRTTGKWSFIHLNRSVQPLRTIQNFNGERQLHRWLFWWMSSCYGATCMLVCVPGSRLICFFPHRGAHISWVPGELKQMLHFHVSRRTMSTRLHIIQRLLRNASCESSIAWPLWWPNKNARIFFWLSAKYVWRTSAARGQRDHNESASSHWMAVCLRARVGNVVGHPWLGRNVTM